MNELALFAGGGGGLLASGLLGWRTRCAVEINPYARKTLLARQKDGHLEDFPIWDDVKTFDGRPWRGSISVVTGGFPCQDISTAGQGKGITGERSGLFFEMLRIVSEVQPAYVFAENSPNLRTKGLTTVVKELNSLGYDCRWCVLGAWHVGAPHKRNRMWILAHAPSVRQPGQGQPINSSNTETTREGEAVDAIDECFPHFWSTEPPLGRVANGVANRMERLTALGNGQVPAVAALAWRVLSQGLQKENYNEQT